MVAIKAIPVAILVAMLAACGRGGSDEPPITGIRGSGAAGSYADGGGGGMAQKGCAIVINGNSMECSK